MDINAIVNRAINIIVKPAEEWEQVKNEDMPSRQIFLQYLLPFIILMGAASIVGNSLFSTTMFSSFGFGYVLFSAVVNMVISFLGVYISAYIINELAGSFDTAKNINNVFKVVIYSFTPYFVASIITGLVPQLIFIQLFGFYSFYLLWVGMNHLLSPPEDKRAGYVVVSGLIIIGVFAILSILLNLIFSSFLFAADTYNAL
ncbi:MAG TPA: Yip1 family protein [Bacteroidales bacterium]|nr:Yip1 family protein [Bacteroidales bacterium]